jgi:hypothetical protein
MPLDLATLVGPAATMLPKDMLFLVLVSMMAGAGALCTCILFFSWGRSSAAGPTKVVVPAPSRGPSPSPPTASIRERARRQDVCADTLAEELAKLTIAILRRELKEKQLLVGGLKGDLVSRLRPAMADEQVYQVACGIARQRSRSIPLEAMRSNKELTDWIHDGVQRQPAQ